MNNLNRSGRLTDLPPGSFLIPQQLAVPPVPQLDDVPCPKTIGEPGTPQFPKAGHWKKRTSIHPASIGFLFHVTFSGLPCPFLGFKNSHSTYKQSRVYSILFSLYSPMLTTSTFQVHSFKQLCCSFQHYMCIGATNTKGTYTGQRTSTLNTMLSNSLFDSSTNKLYKPKSKIHTSGLRKLEVR